MSKLMKSATEPEEHEVLVCSLRLYVAAGTPNSARAEHNLRAAIDKLDGSAPRLNLKIIDVFKEAKRALADGVIVTPTLVCAGAFGRAVVMGDLKDSLKLTMFLKTSLGFGRVPGRGVGAVDR